MAFRLLRICSSEEIFEKRLLELKSDFLIPRKYNAKVIDAQFTRIKNLPGENFKEKRKNALKKKEFIRDIPKEKRIIAPMTFNPKLPNIGQVFNKHFKSMIFKKPELKKSFHAPPMPALRQPPSLRKMLCSSRLSTIVRGDQFQRRSHRSAPGWKKCGKGTTTCCPYALPNKSSVKGLVTGFKHEIKDAVNCETKNCIYYLICRKSNCKEYPKCEYIGLTTRPFRKRLAEHKQYVKSKILDTPSGKHYNQSGHNLSHLAGLVLEEVKSSDPFVLRAREFMFIQKFDTFRNGLNGEV